ncbi:hypothetical protein PR202_ga01819 [Eleusine coracana subsp. coracana]|uniref:DUF7894 domain-containing protein n=1 Tax=Eleusine coracana subsp. coracana TaxID=191504 RepID=A0AAV5BJA4_ELECO|nr:hypothetical protein PR202_ga01132 [Eleusine coracana subsp. coracana]GJM86002.1 hypothetical protein PR202_ga01819 [Eleusine coracana subsp. coracana]
MRFAPRVLLLVRDAAGYGAALVDSLQPPRELTRESETFELPLEKYALDGEKASGELVNFLDSSGSPQVSIIVLPDYKPPLAACAMNEVLEWISSEATSSERVLIIPFITRPSSYHHGMMPAVLLVASGGRQQQAKSSSESDLEVLQYIGEHLARHIKLEFSKEIIRERGVEKSPIVQEPWRELYG